MTTAILAGCLIAAMLIVGGRRGLRTVLALGLNFGVLYALLAAVSAGAAPVPAALAACLLISACTLFFSGGFNEKTVSAFLAVLVTLVSLGLVMGLTSYVCNTPAFAWEEYVPIAGLSFTLGLDMGSVTTACILLGMVGAVIDTSIAVSTALYEVGRNNPGLGRADLFRSGMRIGQDIIGTTMNTLYFAFLGTYTALLLRFMIFSTPALEALNNAAFCQEYVRIIGSALGCIIVIPFSAAVTSSLLSGRLSPLMEKLRAGGRSLLAVDERPDGEAKK